MALAGIIMAAGQGTRMKSETPKVLHLVCGLPMVEHVGRAMQKAGVNRPVVIVGHGAEKVKESLDSHAYAFATQSEQLGTGHAVLMAKEALASYEGCVLVAPGDTPLLDGDALSSLVAKHRETGALCTVAAFRLSDPTGYGRVITDAMGRPLRIVEQKDCSTEEAKVNLVNSSVYCFDSKTLFALLPRLGTANAQGEYYLTDVLSEIIKMGGVTAVVEYSDPDLFMGVNDRWSLAQAGKIFQTRILRHHALNGVTIVDPSTTFIEADVKIGQDTVIEPMTSLAGATTIGANCVIGPQTKIQSSQIGDNVEVLMSYVKAASMADGSRCGPFAHLRPGAQLGERVKIGNFVEVKKSVIGDGAQVNHLSYIGDATIGTKTNIGAGTITCNYDGFRKHETTIGSHCFVGSNSTLVAPVTLQDGVFIAAGSVITKDVSADALALGRAQQVEKTEWAKRWREKNQS